MCAVLIVISEKRVYSAQTDTKNTHQRKSILAAAAAALLFHQQTIEGIFACAARIARCAPRIIRGENHSQVLVFIRSASAQRKTFSRIYIECSFAVALPAFIFCPCPCQYLRDLFTPGPMLERERSSDCWNTFPMRSPEYI